MPQNIWTDITTRFSNKPMSDEQQVRCSQILTKCFDLANDLCHLCPESRELSLAITSLEDVLSWSTKAIRTREE